MPVAFNFETTMTKAQYDKMSDAILQAGVPAGLLQHIATETKGGVRIFEVWQSPSQQEAFMRSTLGPLMNQAQVPQPRGSMELVVNHIQA